MACLLLSSADLQSQATTVMDWDAFRSLVLLHHPLSQQADLSADQAEAALLRARGGFDPKLFGDHSSKVFKEKTYFQFSEAGVKLPTWAGIELKGAYNYARGSFLNPENTLPEIGQAQLGLRWSVGQGLLMDERRANLGIAKTGLEAGAAERLQLRNELLMEAAKYYWSWVAAASSIEIYTAALRQAQIRYEGIRESYKFGDKPAVDTLEAFIQVQNRQIDLNFANTDLQNAQTALSNFLWTSDNAPMAPENIPDAPATLVTSVRLERITDAQVEDMVAEANNLYPELTLYRVKLQQLDIERKLKLEKRKPVLDLEYNLLGSGWQFFPTAETGSAALVNDIKWGLGFSYPIPNRKARGDYQFTKIKIAQASLGLQQKQLEVDNKIRQYATLLNNLQQQISLYAQITEQYRLLLDAENEKFRFGESSIFLINTREQKWLDARIKLLKLNSEYFKTEGLAADTMCRYSAAGTVGNAGKTTSTVLRFFNRPSGVSFEAKG